MSAQISVFILFILLFFYVTYTRPTGLQDYPEETHLAAVFKCLPILTLIYMTASSRDCAILRPQLKNSVTLGLGFSMIGDYLLIWRITNFIPGASAFAVAHIFYLRGYGFKPTILLVALIWGATAVNTFIFIQPSLTATRQMIIGCYTLLLASLGWRTTVHWWQYRTLASLLAMLGALLFNISDFILILDHAVYPGQIPCASLLIMITYYAAQLGIALSVVGFEPATIEQKKR